MGRPKHNLVKHKELRREVLLCPGDTKQTASKSSSGKAPKKSSYCGICTVGHVVYPESIDDDVPPDCNHVFEENFEMFLRKQKDKNTRTSMQFKMKHEQRIGFASLTKRIGENISEDGKKHDASILAMVGERFLTNRRASKWADDLLEGFDGAEALIAHFTELSNDYDLSISEKFIDLKMSNLSIESWKAVKDIVISARRWVVKQLDLALKEFKEFRDGLNEKEREKYDKLVEKQYQNWSNFECGDLSFEEVDAIIKEIQKEMDDIISRHNNQNKDIDSLVELIEGKQLGAIPKNKKEKIPKSKKKKNRDTHFENVNEVNISTQQLEKQIKKFPSDGTKMAGELKTTKEKLKNFTSEAFSFYNEDFKAPEASLSDDTKMADELKKTTETLNITKAQLEETKNRLKEEQSKNVNLIQENNLLKSKLLDNDFKKYRDVLRQRQKNSLRVIDDLRSSPELENSPQAQLALRSLHEFSARLLLADQELASQYNILQRSQTNETIPELHFDLSNVEPPDLGSSCINLLCSSILMTQSSTAPLPPPLTSRSSTSSPPGSSSPTSHSRNITQPSRVFGTKSYAPPPVGIQGTSPGFSHSLLPSGSVVSFPSNGAAATSGGTAGATHMNFKPSPHQIRKCASSKLANNKKVASFLERGGGGSSINTEDECSICFEEMRPSNSFYLKSCRHRFHKTCMKQWLVSHRGVSSTCPMCRTYIVKEDEFVNLGASGRF